MIKLSELVKCKCPVCGSNLTSTAIFQDKDNKYLINDDVYFPIGEKLKIETVCLFCGYLKTNIVPFDSFQDYLDTTVKTLLYNYEFNKNRDISNDEYHIISKFEQDTKEYMEKYEFDGTKEYILKAFKYIADKPDNEIEFDLEVEL